MFRNRIGRFIFCDALFIAFFFWSRSLVIRCYDYSDGFCYFIDKIYICIFVKQVTDR